MPVVTKLSPSVAVNGAAIRARRMELGENLRIFAARVPMSIQYLSDIELGRRRQVSPAKFIQIRKALRVPASQAAVLKAAA